MTDYVDLFRHWLIRKLACGDMILMNFEVRSDRGLVRRNLGPSLIHGADITVVDADIGLAFGRNLGHRIAALHLVDGSGVVVRNSAIRALSHQRISSDREVQLNG